MYFLTVVLLMAVLPIGSILVELLIFKAPTTVLPLVGKWCVFWAVGVRQFLAGLRQTIRPEFTAESIFGIKGKDPLPIVQELGFANLSMGVLGILSIIDGGLVFPSAIVSGVFFGIAGFKHALRRERNLNENVAMVSDLLLFAVLAAFLILTILGG
jgi:hypothetical protein